VGALVGAIIGFLLGVVTSPFACCFFTCSDDEEDTRPPSVVPYTASFDRDGGHYDRVRRSVVFDGSQTQTYDESGGAQAGQQRYDRTPQQQGGPTYADMSNGQPSSPPSITTMQGDGSKEGEPYQQQPGFDRGSVGYHPNHFAQPPIMATQNGEERGSQSHQQQQPGSNDLHC